MGSNILIELIWSKYWIIPIELKDTNNFPNFAHFKKACLETKSLDLSYLFINQEKSITK